VDIRAQRPLSSRRRNPLHVYPRQYSTIIIIIIYLLFLYDNIILYHSHVRVRNGSCETTYNDNNITTGVYWYASEQRANGTRKRLSGRSVRFFLFLPPNSRWPTDDELRCSSGRGHRRITSSSRPLAHLSLQSSVHRYFNNNYRRVTCSRRGYVIIIIIIIT